MGVSILLNASSHALFPRECLCSFHLSVVRSLTPMIEGLPEFASSRRLRHSSFFMCTVTGKPVYTGDHIGTDNNSPTPNKACTQKQAALSDLGRPCATPLATVWTHCRAQSCTERSILSPQQSKRRLQASVPPALSSGITLRELRRTTPATPTTNPSEASSSPPPQRGVSSPSTACHRRRCCCCGFVRCGRPVLFAHQGKPPAPVLFSLRKSSSAVACDGFRRVQRGRCSTDYKRQKRA